MTCAHSWKFGGNVGRPAGWDRKACEAPVSWVCRFCRETKFGKCGGARLSKCAPCAAIKRGDVRAVARSGATDSVLGLVALLTLTAPGRDVLPWDLTVCGHLDDSDCSGKIGCRVDARAAAIWHRTLPRRWSDFVTYVRRDLGEVEFFKAYEWQSRGVLHVHVLARVPAGVSARRFRASVRLRAMHWGFGSQCDVRWLPAGSVDTEVRPGVTARSPRIAAAGYVAKYVSKGYDELGDVLTLDGATGEVRHLRLRPWSSSRNWGDSMATCVARRRDWWLGGGGVRQAAAGALAAPAHAVRLDPYSTSSTLTLAGAFSPPAVAGPCAV